MKYLLTILLSGIIVAVELQADLLKVCYYPNWAQHRQRGGNFEPGNIDASKCTHLIYAFAKVQKNLLESVEWNDESTSSSVGNFEKVNNLKKKNTTLKTLLAVGGWKAAKSEITKMFSKKKNIDKFVKSTIEYLRKWNFDGLDLNFVFLGNKDSSSEDKKRFSNLIKELSSAFAKESKSSKKTSLLLTAAVAARKNEIDRGYDVSVLNGHLDFVSLMAYDYHGAWDTETGFNAPLYSTPGDELNLDWSAKYWVSKGLRREMLVAGLATYGRCFRLKDISNTKIGAPTSGKCPQGFFTKERGLYSYYEICMLLKNQKAVVNFSEIHQSSYLLYGGLWVGFDDERSFLSKLEYIMDQGHAGVMVFDLSMDDFTGSFCSKGTKYPLSSILVSEPSELGNPIKGLLSTTTQVITTTTTLLKTKCVVSSTSNEAHPNDCTKYLICLYGELMERDCPSTLYYHPDIQNCVSFRSLSTDRKKICKKKKNYKHDGLHIFG